MLFNASTTHGIHFFPTFKTTEVRLFRSRKKFSSTFYWGCEKFSFWSTGATFLLRLNRTKSGTKLMNFCEKFSKIDQWWRPHWAHTTRHLCGMKISTLHTTFHINNTRVLRRRRRRRQSHKPKIKFIRLFLEFLVTHIDELICIAMYQDHCDTFYVQH